MSAISIKPQGDQIAVSGDISIRELPANQFIVQKIAFDELTAEQVVQGEYTVTIRNIRTPRQYEEFIPKLLTIIEVSKGDILSILGIRNDLCKVLLDYTDLTTEQLDELGVLDLKTVIESFINSKLITALNNSFSGENEKKAPETE
jgi:hypothetical protein